MCIVQFKDDTITLIQHKQFHEYLTSDTNWLSQGAIFVGSSLFLRTGINISFEYEDFYLKTLLILHPAVGNSTTKGR